MVKQKIRDAFGPDADDALKIARCESGYSPSTVGDTQLPSTKAFQALGLPYGPSIGVFEIRLLPGRPGKEWLLDADNNIAYAKKMFDRDGGWSAWSCKYVLR